MKGLGVENNGKGLRGDAYKKYLKSRADRSARIVAAYDGGATLRAIGAEYSLSAERVRQIIGKERRKAGIEPVLSAAAIARAAAAKRKKEIDARLMRLELAEAVVERAKEFTSMDLQKFAGHEIYFDLRKAQRHIKRSIADFEVGFVRRYP